MSIRPVSSAIDRLDSFTLFERCAVDQIATVISRELYGRPYDEISRGARVKVEGAARHALRAPHTAWMKEARVRAYLALEGAMKEQMGREFATLPAPKRSTLAQIGVSVVLAAVVSALELERPFESPGAALRIYDEADAERKAVR